MSYSSCWVRICEVYLTNSVFPTIRLKLKRPQTAKKFRPQIDSMYEQALKEERPQAKL